MAKKTPAKKTAAKPVKAAPSPKAKPVKKAPAPVAKTVKKTVTAPVKKAPLKKPLKKASAPFAKTAKKVIAPVQAKQKPVAKTASKSAPKIISKPLPAPVVKKAPPKKAKSALPPNPSDRALAQTFIRKPLVDKNLVLTPFLTKQRQRLLELKDTLLDAMRGVARDNLHAGSDTSAFGMHQADAGSDAYDRDFALGMLSKEQGSLYEIDEALKRINDGTYGVCDICEKPIRHDRLEALPFTRYTVDCQAELEKRQHHHTVRPHINSLFGLTEEEAESEEEETTETT